MKKIFTIFAGLFLLAFSFKVHAGPGDTLGITLGSEPEFAPNGSVSIIGLQGVPGYFYGTFWLPASTGADYVSIAQTYTNLDPVSVVGIIVEMGAKRKGPNTTVNPFMTLKLHNYSDNSAYSIQNQTLSETADIVGPSDTALGSYQLSFNDIDTAGFNVINVNPSVAFTENIVVSANLESIKANGDTLGFFSDQPGDGMGLNYSFHQLLSLGERYWVRSTDLAGSVGNTNIAMFIILDAESSIKDAPFVDGIKAASYPNPAANTSTVAYTTLKNGRVNIELLSATGKLISAQDLGFKIAGTYKTELNVSGLSAGIYLFSISHEDGTRYTQRIIVSH